MKILILEGLHGNNKGKKKQWRLKRTNLKVGDTVVLDCHDWKIIEVIKQRRIFLKRTENDFNQKMLGISCDLGADEDCMVGYRVNIDGNINIDSIKYFPKKEVKKVRPYFETKVVKVKEKKCNHVGRAYPFSKTGDTIECVECGKKFILGQEEPKPKGNWVNGECIDKIKFPCFCSYGGSCYGIITRTRANEAFNNEFYTLHGIEKQHSSVSSVRSYHNLADLIRVWDIHILKGKIIIFDDDDTNEKYDIDIEEE